MSMSATEILSLYWDGNLPVPPERIARAMGIDVHAEFGLPGDISGMVEYEHGRPVIRYDMTEPPVRQRFTIAHEIGHLALGHLSDGRTRFRDPASNFSTGSSSPEEREANAFAAQMLMPENVLRFAVTTKGIQDVSRLANLFNVSQVAMGYRLRNLGLING